ncbi:MAG: condensation domain-containing protein, partial [Streptomyces sp.]
DVVGMFVDPVVLRLRPTERPDGVASETLGDALAGVRERFAEALAHSEVPYLDVAQRLGRDALFSVIATMFDTEEEGGLPVIDVPLPATSKFPFAIEFLARPDGLQLHVLYAADRYLPSTVDRVVSHIVDFLQTLAVVGPGAPLDGYRARPARTPFARLRDRPTGDAEAEWAR